MPRVRLVLFREADGSVPLIDWLDGLEPQARERCYVRLERLEAMGHELRREHPFRANHERL